MTTATLARIAILQLFGKRYSASNPGSKTQIVGYEPRPLLKLTPPENSSDKRTRTFNFIDAVTSLPSNFTSDEIDGLMKRISPKLHGKLRSLFVVINDDMVKKRGRRDNDGLDQDSEVSGRRNKRGASSSAGSPSRPSKEKK